MRLIFLNRFYWPDEPATAQLLTDLAEALSARGHEVIVITGRHGRSGLAASEVRAGVRILRVNRTHWGRHSLAGRAMDFLTFLAGACLTLARTAKKGDLVVAMTDPPMLGTFAWPVSRIRGARLIHWTQDVFPEVATVLSPGPLGSLAGALLRPFRNLAWKKSAGCVALGPDMAAHIARAGVAPGRISVIPNWSPAGLEPAQRGTDNILREEWGLRGKFVVVYSGNLGRVHELEVILDVADALRAEAQIVFVFIGDGAQRAALEKSATARGLANVHFHGHQPRARLSAALALGDVHLVTLRPGCEGLVFPSKLYGIAAIGRAIVFIGPRECDVARIVTSSGMGLAFSRGETAAIAGALTSLAADPSRCAAFERRGEEFIRTGGLPAHAVHAWEGRLAREASC